MCTATWTRFEAGYELFFTRDELKTRGIAAPPTARDRSGVRFVAPTDADAGGTWIGANELGLTLALLNGYVERGARTRGRRSRGALVAELCDAASAEDVEARLGRIDLTDFLSFRLLALGSDLPVRELSWDGARLAVERDARAPVVSSSVDPSGAAAARGALYAAEVAVPGRPSAEALLAFHASHVPERGPVSVCMHRADASSVSLTRVHVDGERVRMTYHGGSPCEGRPAVVEILPRRRPASPEPSARRLSPG